MKNIMNYTIVVLLFGIVGCAKTPVTVDSDKTMTEVQNAIGKVYEIWETKDINSVKEIYAENVVGFGTDESEYWKGIDEFEPSIKTQMTAINDLNFDFKNETIHISPSGDMASYSHKVDMTFTSQGEPGKLKFCTLFKMNPYVLYYSSKCKNNILIHTNKKNRYLAELDVY